MEGAGKVYVLAEAFGVLDCVDWACGCVNVSANLGMALHRSTSMPCELCHWAIGKYHRIVQ